MYLVGIIYNLNFAILIVNEIYGRNRRSIREDPKKLALIREFPGNTGELVTLHGTESPTDSEVLCPCFTGIV
jgi:hypothetical protein